MVIGIAVLLSLDDALGGRALMDNLLSIITFLPLVAAAILALFLRGDDAAAQQQRQVAGADRDHGDLPRVAVPAVRASIPPNTGFQFVEERDWILGLNYKMGVDGISVLFVLLTTFLMPITILSCWDVDARVKEYMIAFLVLETLMLGVFCALDLVLFYLFFEAGLIPMFLIIGIWGGKERIYAAFKFFLYTFLGSVLMLVAMIAMYVDAGTTDIPTLLTHQFASETLQRPRLPDRRRHADAAVARLLRQLRGQDADVAGPHLAARRPRAGADGGVGGAGGDPAEDGRLRLPALQPADVPGRVGRCWRPFDLLAVGDRHRLHLAGGAGAVGHEEADRLFVGRPYGLCDDGDLRRRTSRASTARSSRCSATASSRARCSFASA